MILKKVFHLQIKENSEDGSDDSSDLQEPHYSDDDVTIDGEYFF